MIIRVMGEGQFEVADDALGRLNELDANVESAVESRDEGAFRSALSALLDDVRTNGTRVPDEELVNSDLVLPPSDATVDEVSAMLSDEGLIPD